MPGVQTFVPVFFLFYFFYFPGLDVFPPLAAHLFSAPHATLVCRLLVVLTPCEFSGQQQE